MKYKYAIFIGRFEPFHLGHQSIINQGFDIAEKVIVVLGSHNIARNVKSPWTSDERKEMVLSSLPDEQKNRVEFLNLRDHLYNQNLWIIELQNKVSELTEETPDNEIALIGFKSDKSSDYLNLFPRWQFISCPTRTDCHASKIRQLYFTHDNSYKSLVPVAVATFLEDFKKEETFRLLKDEYDFLIDYKERWKGSPIFNTVDVVCIKSGHILLVRRGKSLGKGLLALPGGFLNADEEIEDAAIRELKEETVIKLSKEELKNNIVSHKVFGSPLRSNRGRVITNCFLIDLGAGPLDKVKGSDDEDRAFWLPLHEALNREQEFFEDHYSIIEYMVYRL